MRTLYILLAFLLALPAPAPAQTVAGGEIALVDAFPDLPDFDRVVDLQAPDDGSNRLFAVEQDGRILVFDNDEGASSTARFLDIRDRVYLDDLSPEPGLLGLVFDPDFAQNRYFYVYYNSIEPEPPLRNVVARFQVSATNPNFADPATEVILLQVPKQDVDHNGGQLAFGPPEGPGGERYLYIAMGDGARSTNAQNPAKLLGKLLRVDVDGGGLPLDCALLGQGAATVPPDNPGVLSGPMCDEIYASGFRNPWRFSFDPAWRLWLGDVGQNRLEEIDVVSAGANYGWAEYEGSFCFDEPCSPEGMTFPVWEYQHLFTPEGGFAVIGGYVYTGPACAALRGRYVYADNVTSNFWALDYDGTTATNALIAAHTGLGPSSFGVDEQGSLYAAGLPHDRIVTFACPQAVTVAVEPVGGPIVIGPDGGPFSVDLTLTNTTGQAQTVQVWADADLSNGLERAAVIGPLTRTLGPGAVVVRRVQVLVPAFIPSGTSTLMVKVGAFPDGSASADRFTVTKLPDPAAGIAGAAAGAAVADGPAAWPAAWAEAETAAEAGAGGAVRSVRVVVHPNPFSGRAVVGYELAAGSAVRVAVYDVLGREVAVLVDGERPAGRHEVVLDGSSLPAGAYLVRLEAGGRVETARLTLVR
jgi:glucose/arabinose dehydrogenase